MNKTKLKLRFDELERTMSFFAKCYFNSRVMKTRKPQPNRLGKIYR